MCICGENGLLHQVAHPGSGCVHLTLFLCMKQCAWFVNVSKNGRFSRSVVLCDNKGHTKLIEGSETNMWGLNKQMKPIRLWNNLLLHSWQQTTKGGKTKPVCLSTTTIWQLNMKFWKYRHSRDVSNAFQWYLRLSMTKLQYAAKILSPKMHKCVW